MFEPRIIRDENGKTVEVSLWDGYSYIPLVCPLDESNPNVKKLHEWENKNGKLDLSDRPPNNTEAKPDISLSYADVGADEKGTADKAIAAHKSEEDAHTPSQVGAEPVGTVAAGIKSHEISNNHPTATPTQKGLLSASDKVKLDNLDSALSGKEPQGASANAIAAHKAETKPHTAQQVGAEPVGSIAAAIAAHEASPNHPQFASAGHVHPQYATLAEVQARNSSLVGDAIVTLSPSWTSSAGVQCFKLSSGLTFMEGLVARSSGKASVGETIGTIPAGFRPRVSQRFRVVDGSVGALLNNSNPFVEISPTTGEIKYGNSGAIPLSTPSLSFGGVFYLASAT